MNVNKRQVMREVSGTKEESRSKGEDKTVERGERDEMEEGERGERYADMSG